MIKHAFQAFHYFLHTTYLVGREPILHLKICYLLCFLSSVYINYFSSTYLHMATCASSIMSSWLVNCSCMSSHILTFDYLSHVQKITIIFHNPLFFYFFQRHVSMHARTQKLPSCSVLATSSTCFWTRSIFYPPILNLSQSFRKLLIYLLTIFNVNNITQL